MSRLVTVVGGTPAIHQLGDIRRDQDDTFVVSHRDGDHLVGHWLTGLGFVNVRVPASGTRRLSHDEADRLSHGRIQVGSIVSDPLDVDPLDVEPGWSPPSRGIDSSTAPAAG